MGAGVLGGIDDRALVLTRYLQVLGAQVGDDRRTATATVRDANVARLPEHMGTRALPTGRPEERPMRLHRVAARRGH